MVHGYRWNGAPSRHAKVLLRDTTLALTYSGWHMRCIYTLVIQGEAIGLHVVNVKLHVIRTATPRRGEHQHRRGHFGVGFEHPGMEITTSSQLPSTISFRISL